LEVKQSQLETDLNFHHHRKQPDVNNQTVKQQACKDNRQSTSHDFFLYGAGGEFAEMVYGFDDV